MVLTKSQWKCELTSGKEGGRSLARMKRRFTSVLTNSSSKWNRWDGAHKEISNQQLLKLMSAIVFFAKFDTVVVYRKGFVKSYHESAADSITFLDMLFLKLSRFSSGIPDFFSLLYTRSLSRLTENSRVKFFSSSETVFQSSRS